MFSSGCCGRPRVLKRHSTRHRFEVLSRKKLIKRVLNLSEEPVRDNIITTSWLCLKPCLTVQSVVKISISKVLVARSIVMITQVILKLAVFVFTFETGLPSSKGEILN